MRVDPVVRLIATRLLFSIVSLFAVSLIVFSSVELLPGDTAERILGREATKDSLAALRTKLHLEDPATLRYARWFGGVVHGDFGRSLVADRPVLPYISSYFERTLLLGGWRCWSISRSASASACWRRRSATAPSTSACRPWC